MTLKTRQRRLEGREMERVVYGECRRNHAAQLGSHSTDGCGEFYPSNPPEAPTRCAACGCHRNFHRRHTIIHLDDEPGKGAHSAGNGGCGVKKSHGVKSHRRRMKEFTDLEESKEEAQVKPRGRGKKPRTMFTAKQKEMMRAFAESLGWTMTNKETEAEVKKFCEEVGVTRYIFRTWLNNNKKIYGAAGSSSSRH